MSLPHPTKGGAAAALFALALAMAGCQKTPATPSDDAETTLYVGSQTPPGMASAEAGVGLWALQARTDSGAASVDAGTP